jgi:hypothetical protein
MHHASTIRDRTPHSSSEAEPGHAHRPQRQEIRDILACGSTVSHGEAGLTKGETPKGKDGKPTVPAPAAPTPAPAIASSTVETAPDGSANTRTKVGVCEQVDLSAAPATGLTWTASVGTLTTLTSGGRRWTAPETAATATITATPATGTAATVSFTVVPPKDITAPGTPTELAYPAGQQGVGMTNVLLFGPTDVCFSQLEWLEDPGPGSNISGYFTSKPANSLAHKPNTHWLPINANNSGLIDTAAFFGWPSPWSAGGFEWDIPNRYRKAGSGSGYVFFNSLQIHEILDTTGNSQEGKYGQVVQRSP